MSDEEYEQYTGGVEETKGGSDSEEEELGGGSDNEEDVDDVKFDADAVAEEEDDDEEDDEGEEVATDLQINASDPPPPPQIEDEEEQSDNEIEGDGSAPQSDDDASSGEDESDEEDDYIQTKIDVESKLQFIKNVHTQEISEDYEEISFLANVKRNGDGIITDLKHRTTPILTKYERTKILGIRISQLNRGARPLIKIQNTMIIDNNIIAEKELEEKVLPFIVTRPLPDGRKEHWRLQDLEVL